MTRASPNPVATIAGAGPDAPFGPAQVEGVIWRRVIAYGIDLAIIGGISVIAFLLFVPATILSFGLLATPLTLLFALIPLAYHTLLIGGKSSATLGQRLFGLRVMDMGGGGRPDYAQAAVQCVLFYVTLMATGLLLVVVFFNPLRRTIHDWLSGTVVVRRSAGSPA